MDSQMGLGDRHLVRLFPQLGWRSRASLAGTVLFKKEMAHFKEPCAFIIGFVCWSRKCCRWYIWNWSGNPKCCKCNVQLSSGSPSAWSSSASSIAIHKMPGAILGAQAGHPGNHPRPDIAYPLRTSVYQCNQTNQPKAIEYLKEWIDLSQVPASEGFHWRGRSILPIHRFGTRMLLVLKNIWRQIMIWTEIM